MIQTHSQTQNHLGSHLPNFEALDAYVDLLTLKMIPDGSSKFVLRFDDSFIYRHIYFLLAMPTKIHVNISIEIIYRLKDDIKTRTVN